MTKKHILRKEFGSISPFKASVVCQFTANDIKSNMFFTLALIRKHHFWIKIQTREA